MSLKHKILSIIFFVLALQSISSGIIFILDISLLQDVVDFPSYFLEHSWIMFLFIPFSLVSLIFGLVIMKKGKTFWRNIIAGVAATILICILGCLCFFKHDISHYYPDVHNVDGWFYVTPMPIQGKISTRHSGSTTISKAYIIEGADRDMYERRLLNSIKQEEKSDTPLLTSNFTYWKFSGARNRVHTLILNSWFILVDTDTGEYNPTEEIHGHHYVFASYNFTQHQMTIIEFIGK